MEAGNQVFRWRLIKQKNELYKGYGVGGMQKIRGAQAKIEFNPSVFMPPPYRSENKILHLEQIEKVDSPLQRALREQWDESWRFELRMLAARLLTGIWRATDHKMLPLRRRSCPSWHAARRSFFLLADEVGLGKTIEAGMIWQALMQRGQAKRTLIITPAGLSDPNGRRKCRENLGPFSRFLGAISQQLIREFGI